MWIPCSIYFFFFQAEDGIRDLTVTGVQTCALPISPCCPGQRWRWTAAHGRGSPRAPPPIGRSEEHTSELQSQSNLVCRLLLEKKTTYTIDTRPASGVLLCAYSTQKPTYRASCITSS